MTTVYVVWQCDYEGDGFTGCDGVFTNYDRAIAVCNRRNADKDGYLYYIAYTDLDPTDKEIFE